MPDPTLITVIVVGSIILSFALSRLLLPLLTGQAKRKRMMATGRQARAVITSLGQTGTMINNQPRCRIGLRVEPKDAPAYDATVTQVVLLTQIPQFQPGTVVTVRYDPANPQNVVIESVGYVGIDAAAAQRMLTESQALLNALNAPGGGTAASAIVTAFEPTGVSVNGDNPLAVVAVKVLPDGGTPFDARVTGVFGRDGLAKYQPGKTVAVRYDPNDPTRVSFDVAKTKVATSDP